MQYIHVINDISILNDIEKLVYLLVVLLLYCMMGRVGDKNCLYLYQSH